MGGPLPQPGAACAPESKPCSVHADGRHTRHTERTQSSTCGSVHFPDHAGALARTPCNSDGHLPLQSVLSMLHAEQHPSSSIALTRTVCRYLWITIVYNLTYTMALYALVLFYMGTHELLAPFNPMLKFTVVKLVVFLTFWQVSLGIFRVQQYMVQQDCNAACILVVLGLCKCSCMTLGLTVLRKVRSDQVMPCS